MDAIVTIDRHHRVGLFNPAAEMAPDWSAEWLHPTAAFPEALRCRHRFGTAFACSPAGPRQGDGDGHRVAQPDATTEAANQEGVQQQGTT